MILNFFLLDSMHKKLQKFHKEFVRLKKTNSRTSKNQDLKVEVLDKAGDLFN